MTKQIFAYKGTFGGLLYTLANSVADKKAIEKMHQEVPQVLQDIEDADIEEQFEKENFTDEMVNHRY